ncbi:MAG: hypothetical protein V9G19_10850 [Tetrasphaera sp.]
MASGLLYRAHGRSTIVEMTQRRVEQMRQPALALRGYAVVLAAPDSGAG